MPVSVDAAAQIYQDAVRHNVHKASLRLLVQAAIMVLAGLLAIIFPVISSEAIVLTVGWLLIISGLVQALGLIAARHAPDAGLQAVSVALGLLIGFLILRNPAQSLVALSLLIVVFFMIEGISKIVWSMTIRPLAGWAWVMLSGFVSVALSILLVMNIDTAASWLLALLIGIHLVSAGVSIGYLAWLARRTTAPLPG